MPVTASFVTSQGTFKARLLVVEAISLIQTGPQDRPRTDVALKRVVIEETQD